MRINLPHGPIDNHIIDWINLVLSYSDLPKVTRQDRIRGYIAVPSWAARDVSDSLRAVGLAT